MTEPAVRSVQSRSIPARAGDAVLPVRVRDALREQQASSEILIGWIQFAVVGAFGTLYAI